MELVRGLYKIDESYDIDELHKQADAFLDEQKQLEKQLEVLDKGLKKCYNIVNAKEN